MNAKLCCPSCGAPVSTEEWGDLVTSQCLACGWLEQSTVSRVFPEFPFSVPATVLVKATSPVPAAALAKLREVSALVRKIPLASLQEQLSSAHGISLGLQGEHRAKELRRALEGLGFEVVCVSQHNVA